jgi:IS5 family transposase
MHRTKGQLGFLDTLLGEGLGRNERLDRIDALIDWTPIDAFVSALHAASEGRKAYPPLTMVKALLLQQWYGLSDPRLEEALSDTLSFRRFVGFGHAGRHARPFDYQPLPQGAFRAESRRASFR